MVTLPWGMPTLRPQMMLIMSEITTTGKWWVILKLSAKGISAIKRPSLFVEISRFKLRLPLSGLSTTHPIIAYDRSENIFCCTFIHQRLFQVHRGGLNKSTFWFNISLAPSSTNALILLRNSWNLEVLGKIQKSTKNLCLR